MGVATSESQGLCEPVVAPDPAKEANGLDDPTPPDPSPSDKADFTVFAPGEEPISFDRGGNSFQLAKSPGLDSKHATGHGTPHDR